MNNIDNIDPIKSFFPEQKIQEKIYNFFKKKNYIIINSSAYLDKTFDLSITGGQPSPQIKNVGVLGTVNIKDIKSIQENRTFKKLQKQIKRIVNKNYAPITIDSSGYIINGHHRYDALRILKHKKILVRVLNLNAKDLLKIKLSAKAFSKLLKYHEFSTCNIKSFKYFKNENQN